MANIVNNPSRAGQRAAAPEFFGENDRYALFPVHTRFDAVCWFVTDALVADDWTGMPSIVIQQDTRNAAFSMLLVRDEDAARIAA